MITPAEFTTMALVLPEVVQLPHFEKTSFRVNKQIFATLDLSKMHGVVKLSEIDQNVFSVYDPLAIYPVPNKWGKQGWTICDLKIIQRDILLDALRTSYCNVAPVRLVALVKNNLEIKAIVESGIPNNL